MLVRGLLPDAAMAYARSESGAIAWLAKLIGSYVDSHPHAADTVSGIRRWWLPSAAREAPLADVESALDSLVNVGKLRRRCLPGGGSVYSAARDLD